MSSDLTFLTNEPGKALLDRFHALLGKNTRLFDCLVGYFFISGFYKLYPSLEQPKQFEFSLASRLTPRFLSRWNVARKGRRLYLSRTPRRKKRFPLRYSES